MKVQLSNIIMSIDGIVNTYTKSIWIEDEFHADGGSFQEVVQTYDEPRLNMKFSAATDVDLNVGSVYSDGMNNFIALYKNKISLMNPFVKEFKIPTELIECYRTYQEE